MRKSTKKVTGQLWCNSGAKGLLPPPSLSYALLCFCQCGNVDQIGLIDKQKNHLQREITLNCQGFQLHYVKVTFFNSSCYRTLLLPEFSRQPIRRDKKFCPASKLAINEQKCKLRKRTN
jgi:hypothetical protein